MRRSTILMDSDEENDNFKERANQYIAQSDDKERLALRTYSPLRQNLLSWYPFKENFTALEIGCELGAITKQLVSIAGSITVCDTKTHCDITKKRVGHMQDIATHTGELREILNKFDYILCLDAPSAAARYFPDSTSPMTDFLSLLKAKLHKDGVMLLGAYNALAIRYLSGARDELSGKYFDSINGYPSQKHPLSFTKKQMESFFRDALINKTYFYYPYPDQMFPTTIYSEDYEPGLNACLPEGALPSPSTRDERQEIFSESSFMRIATDSKLYPIFANAYLIEASI